MFDSLIADTQGFLHKLRDNNTRDWFLAHKPEFDAKLRDPAKALIELMSPRLADMAGYPVSAKLFRQHRDIRFSKDKTPYKTHLHMMWEVQAGARQDPALFFGIDGDGVTVATGLMEFNKDVLADWRKMADLDGAYIASKIKVATDHGYAPWEPTLKRVPPPFDKDHAYGQFLRHKGLIIAGQPDLVGDLPTALETAFQDIWPLSDMLIGVAETPTI